MKWVWLISVLFINSCSAQVSESYDEKLKSLYSHTIPTISVSKAQIDSTIIFLDAREQEEFNVSHIPEAKFVGYKTFKIKNLKEVEKDSKIVVYCSVGYRSEKIGEKLTKEGYSNVLNLYGGIFQWVNEGNDVVDSENKKTSKVHAYSKSWGVWLVKGEKVYE